MIEVVYHILSVHQVMFELQTWFCVQYMYYGDISSKPSILTGLYGVILFVNGIKKR